MARIKTTLSSLVSLAILSSAILASILQPSVTSAATNPRIVFTSDRTGNEDVFIMNGDGSAQTNLTNNPAKDYFAQWASEDSLVFISDRSGTSQVYKVSASGGEPTALTSDQSRLNYGLFVSPDSKRVIVLSGSSSAQPGTLEDPKFLVVDIESGEISNLPDTIISPLLGGWGWMPDSQNIIISTTDNLEDLENDPNAIITTSLHIYNVETQTQSATIPISESTNNVRIKIFPVPSPDGLSSLYMGSHAMGNLGNGETDSFSLYSTRLDGSASLKLTEDNVFGNSTPEEFSSGFGGNGFSFASLPAWSADSSKILFTPASTTSGRYDARIVENNDSADTVNLGAILSEGGYMNWYGSGLLSSSSSNKLMLSTNDDGNFEIYTINEDGTGRVNLTNNPANDQVGFASVETVKQLPPEQPPQPPQTGKIIGATVASVSMISIVLLMAKEIKEKHHSWGGEK